MGTKTGKLFVITGPSGVGKGTLIQQLRESLPALELSISATTRAKRPNETDGTDYLFCTKPQFEEMVAQGEFLEWAEYAGNCYGTPKTPVDRALAEGRHIILEIEVKGALQVIAQYPDAVLIFIAPPSMAVLAQRLTGRDTDHEEVIAARMEVAQWELAQQDQFQHVIVNDVLEETHAALYQLVSRILGNSTVLKA